MSESPTAADQTTHTDATINATVKGLLKGRGFDNPNEIAAYIGVTAATIYNHLNGGTPWKAWEVARAAAFFGVAVGRLYDGLEGTFAPDPSQRGGQQLRPVPSPARRRRPKPKDTRWCLPGQRGRTVQLPLVRLLQGSDLFAA